MTEEAGVSDWDEDGPEDAAPVTPMAFRPEQFRRSVQAEVEPEVPQLVQSVIVRAKGGSLGHLRLLLAWIGLDDAAAKQTPAKTRDVAAELARKWRARMAMADTEKDA